MTSKQHKALLNLTMVFQQFGVVMAEQTDTCVYFQAAKNAPLETRHIELMAKSLKEKTGLKFMLKAV